MEKTASTPIQLFRGMTADELAALRHLGCGLLGAGLGGAHGGGERRPPA